MCDDCFHDTSVNISLLVPVCQTCRLMFALVQRYSRSFYLFIFCIDLFSPVSTVLMLESRSVNGHFFKKNQAFLISYFEYDSLVLGLVVSWLPFVENDFHSLSGAMHWSHRRSRCIVVQPVGSCVLFLLVQRNSAIKPLCSYWSEAWTGLPR